MNDHQNEMSLPRADFSALLEEQVRQRVAGLTDAHAVDEANGDVLDAYIDSAVAHEVDRIDARTVRHEQVLRRQLATMAGERAHVERQGAATAERTAARAGQVLALRASITGATAPGPEPTGADGVIDPVRLRAFAASRRGVLERERGTASGGRFRRSAARLRLGRDAAARRVTARTRALDARRVQLQRADGELAEALLRFKGGRKSTPSTQVGGSDGQA